MRKSLAPALCALALVASLAAPVSASTEVDVIDEILACQAYAGEPTLSSYKVVGFGGYRCSFIGTVGAKICLDYNGVTVATSCRIYRGTGGGEGTTNPVPCLPGIWQTQVTPVGVVGPYSNTHSGPVIFVTDCVSTND